jgi:hypothetical protein
MPLSSYPLAKPVKEAFVCRVFRYQNRTVASIQATILYHGVFPIVVKLEVYLASLTLPYFHVSE